MFMNVILLLIWNYFNIRHSKEIKQVRQFQFRRSHTRTKITKVIINNFSLKSLI